MFIPNIDIQFHAFQYRYNNINILLSKGDKIFLKDIVFQTAL